MSDPIKQSLVRIRSVKGKEIGSVVGAGFLVPGEYILTCAHVLDLALDRSLNTVDRPTEQMKIDFPFSECKEPFTAELILWKPREPKTLEFDIAVLRLVPEQCVPNDMLPVQPALVEDVRNHPFVTCGFPTGHGEFGVWVDGALVDEIVPGWIQVEGTTNTGYRIEQGFSGAPVLDVELKSVIGMVVVFDSNPSTKAAYLIPASRLKAWWGELKVQELGASKLELPTQRYLYELWKGLKFVDYTTQQDRFRSTFRPGKALAFLVDGKLDYGNYWLVNRLIDQVPRARLAPTCRIQLQSYWSPPSLHQVWTLIQKQLKDGSDQSADVGVLAHSVTKAILNRLRYQTVVLVFLDAAYHGEAYLRKIIEEVWSPLAEAVLSSQPAQNACLLAFFVDEARPLPGIMSASAPDCGDLPSTWHTIRLPNLTEFSLEDVTGGVQVISQLMPLGYSLPIKETAEKIHENTRGVPGQVVKSLLLHCNCNWPEGAESWTRVL